MSEKQFKIVGIGEVLFDILPTGEKLTGGAPANFAYISAQLGNRGILTSRVGNDSDGFEILENLKSRGVDISGIQIDDEEKPTGKVIVSLKNGQPEYEITENSAWDFVGLTNDLQDLAKSCDAVCFGSLAQRNEVSRETIRKFLELTKTKCLRIFDANLRQDYFSSEIIETSLKPANVFKLNDEELPKIAELFPIGGTNDINLLQNMRAKFDLKIICLTRGANGSLIISGDKVSEHSGIKTTVENTIGAGDAFTAMLAHGLLRNWNLDKINQKANETGAFVASKSGAMPDFSEFKTI